MGFEWRIISSSFKEQWDSSETEILLQIDTMKNTGLPFPELPEGYPLKGGKIPADVILPQAVHCEGKVPRECIQE